MLFSFMFMQHAIADQTNHFSAVDAYSQKTILDDINIYRVEHGLSQLKMNAIISEEAIKHSRDMAENIMPFGHDGIQERMSRLFKKFKLSHAIAENVAYTSSDAKTVVQQWLQSPGHRKNIEGNYNLTGIGIAHDKYKQVYVTQIFLRTDVE